MKSQIKHFHRDCIVVCKNELTIEKYGATQHATQHKYMVKMFDLTLLTQKSIYQMKIK